MSTNPQPLSFEQFYEKQKNQYAMQKGIQSSTEYDSITKPYINQILLLEKQLKETQDKLPNKERIRIIRQKKKKAGKG